MERGVLLAGRYRLEEHVRTGPDGSLWRAQDEILDRSVSVRVIRSDLPDAAEVADAARRAALVEDPRLIRILDVEDPPGGSFIVAEHLVGTTLTELVRTGPLPPEAARAVVGEAAEALARAGTRGLHHLRLTPDSLVVAVDGSVKVVGTAIEAALAGCDRDGDPPGADRDDALGLVRLLYTGLTGIWPASSDEAPDTPLTPPADLVADVPNDLDTLCTVTLGPHDDGPASPGDLARQLAPWDRTTAAGHPAPVSVRASATTQRSASVPIRTPGSMTPAAVRTPAAREPAPTPTPTSLSRTPTPAPTPAEPGYVYAAPNGVTQPMPRSSAPVVPTAPRHPDPSTAQGPSGATGRPAPPGSSAGSAGAQGVPGLPGYGAGWTRRGVAAEEPLGPFMPPAPIARPSRDQARFVIALVAGLVVLGLVLAIIGIYGFSTTPPLVSSGRSDVVDAPSATSANSASAGANSASAAAAGAPNATGASATGTSAAGTAATVLGVQAFDPGGDDANAGTADHVIDGDPNSTWRSSRYASADFGGLKRGLGLYLRLSPGVVTSVKVLMSGSGGTVELRTASGPELAGSTVVATSQAQGGSAVLTPPQPVTTGGLLLWFTKLPQQTSGEYRLIVSEVVVS